MAVNLIEAKWQQINSIILVVLQFLLIFYLNITEYIVIYFILNNIQSFFL